MYAKWASLMLEYGTMRWAVEIQNTSLERRNLSDLLNGVGITLVDGSPFPLFTSSEIDRCSSADKVFEQAKRLREAFAVPPPTDPGFVLGSVIDYSSDPPMPRAFLEVASTVSTQSIDTVTLIVPRPQRLSDEERERWEREQAEAEYQVKLEAQRRRFVPAFRNAKAAKAIKLLDIENPTGTIVRKIYEVMAGKRINQAFNNKFEIDGTEFKRFKNAVNDPRATGEWATHEVEEHGSKITNAMSREEAVRFIQQLADKWLDHVRRE